MSRFGLLSVGGWSVGAVFGRSARVVALAGVVGRIGWLEVGLVEWGWLSVRGERFGC